MCDIFLVKIWIYAPISKFHPFFIINVFFAFYFLFFLCNVTSFADYLTFKILFNWPYNLYDFALCIHRTYAHTQICSNANISTYPTSWQVFPALQVHGETPVIEISSNKTSQHSLEIIVNYYQHIHTFLRLYFTVTTAAVGGC